MLCHRFISIAVQLESGKDSISEGFFRIIDEPENNLTVADFASCRELRQRPYSQREFLDPSSDFRKPELLHTFESQVLMTIFRS
jgi:hypothetical protein